MIMIMSQAGEVDRPFTHRLCNTYQLKELTEDTTRPDNQITGITFFIECIS